MNGRKERINVKLYNIYDFLFKKYSPKEPLAENIINNNQKFFQHEISLMMSMEYNKVIVANGTSEQDRLAYNNTAVRISNEARINTLPIIQGYFNKNLKCEAVLDPFWMADIYCDNHAGDSFKAALKEIHTQSIKEQHPQSIVDYSLIQTIYVLAHRSATLNREAKIVIDYFHDSISHIALLCLFFSKKEALLPANVDLRLHQLDENKLSQHTNVSIKGTGEIDHLYEWSARYLESQYHLTLRRETNPRNINTANDLATYHFENTYFSSGRKIALDVNPETFDLQKFLLFRSKEIHANLASMNLLGQESQYTTAAGLYQAGLLPQKLALDLGVNKNIVPVEIPIARKTPAEPDTVVISIPPPVTPIIPPVTVPTLIPLAKEPRNIDVIINIAPEPTAPLPVKADSKPVVDTFSPPPTHVIQDNEVLENAGDVFIIDLESLTPPTPSSKREDMVSSSNQPGEKEGDDNDLIITPDDTLTPNQEDKSEHPSLPDTTKTTPSKQALEDGQSGSESESLSDSAEQNTPKKASISILNPKKNHVQINTAEHLQRLYESYINPQKDFSITTYIKTLRNSSQVLRLNIPPDFNALSVIKNIARLPCWKNLGSSFNFFAGKTPFGVEDILQNDPATLTDLVKMLKESLEARNNYYFHGKRHPMTAEFYDLISMLIGDRIQDQVRFVAISAFCQKWKLPDSVMEVEISPEFIYKMK